MMTVTMLSHWSDSSFAEDPDTENKENEGAGTCTLINDAEIVCISRVSTSRQNFSANLNRRIFSKEERAISNMAGVLGKSKLDPKRVDYIKSETYRMYPLQWKKNEKKVWSDCVAAIDKVNRRLNRSKKSKKLCQNYVLYQLHTLILIPNMYMPYLNDINFSFRTEFVYV